MCFGLLRSRCKELDSVYGGRNRNIIGGRNHYRHEEDYTRKDGKLGTYFQGSRIMC
jgi:hypothetical protein